MDKLILKGAFSTFCNDSIQIGKLKKKIVDRKAIPNYAVIHYRVKKKLGEKYTDDEYNLAYIEQLKAANYTCKQFECGNISDSSDILIVSVDDDFDEYTLCGIFNG